MEGIWNKYYIVIFTLITLLIIMTIGVVDAKDIKKQLDVKIKFGTIGPEKSTWLKAVNKVLDEIESESNGRIKFVVYASSAMGDEPDMLRKLRMGQLQGVMFTSTGLFLMASEFSVLSLPFLFNTMGEVDFIRDRLFDTFDEIFAKKGLKIILWSDLGGFVQVFSKKPIRGVDDFQKQRMWCWTGQRLDMEIMNALGVTPIPLPIYEVLPAFQTGLINSAYNIALGAVSLQWYKEINYILKCDIVYGGALVVMNKRFWDRLPEDSRKIVRNKFRHHKRNLIMSPRRDDDIALLGMSKRGIEITHLDPKERERLKKRSSVVWDKLSDDMYPRWLLDEVIKNLEEYRSQKKQ